MPLVVGVRWSFGGKDAGSADSSAIEATEDAASGRAARPDGTAAFRQPLLLAGGVRRLLFLQEADEEVCDRGEEDQRLLGAHEDPA